MSLTAALVTFGVIFLAELPDKTLVASLVLGSRYRPLYVWAGVAAAFLVQVTLAVVAGSVLTLLPRRAVDVIAMILFVIGAVLVYREGREDTGEADRADRADEAGSTGPTPVDASAAAPGGTGGPGTAGGAAPMADPAAGDVAVAADAPDQRRARGFWRVAATSFAVIFVAEMGDLTQISTANLAARFESPVTVWLGSVLALWSVAAIAIAGGRGLLRVVPVRVITKVAASAFAVLAVLSLIDVIRG
ncbi:TMEM165/GDT1 family protein [Frankia sp. CNm7]|uniref:GDT1 family protein n=1 Tax=Frankia nepalensis TaxID=1836974 RepID=A0A937RDN7_9ACTN|nr:TMEM165/GDT1 family protein [Frankia nepalensis]MBL7497704.1 TMEM165/GDT1 family protein [Frankia nepalensis]MBL7514290.1 TMEM165/GDT1 family protein [Frankia nepalensis]MBL7519379.1 TMEM165/GDT1 family protein [Frankia nepalensis]MBL7630246.1 TMEM165/GDT1 family protein [Frankia nepalensis]